MKKVDFRDGTREVVDHIADFLEAYDTYTMTYDEAMKKVNNRFLTDRLNSAQDSAVRQHFARYPKE